MQTVEMAALRFEDITESETLGSGPVRPEPHPWQIALWVAAVGLAALAAWRPAACSGRCCASC